MQRIDQFRNFFPGHVSADRSAQNEESNRKRSQVSSNSQSQDFIKSQSTHFHSSFSGSTGDSQTSFTNRYDDMLASSRHAENKDLLEKCRKDLAASHSLISMQQSVLSSCINQLNSLGRAINEISVKQEDQGKLIMELLTKISEHTAREEEGRAHITSLFLSKQNCVEQEEECSSQDGMSLNAYLNSRSKRVRRESAGGAEGRASSQSSMELSLSPSAELTGNRLSCASMLSLRLSDRFITLAQGSK